MRKQYKIIMIISIIKKNNYKNFNNKNLNDENKITDDSNLYNRKKKNLINYNYGSNIIQQKIINKRKENTYLQNNNENNEDLYEIKNNDNDESKNKFKFNKNYNELINENKFEIA